MTALRACISTDVAWPHADDDAGEMNGADDAYMPRRGDVVVVDGRCVGDPGRLGEILETAGEPGHERLRVHWEDGSETVLYGHAAHIRPRHLATPRTR